MDGIYQIYLNLAHVVQNLMCNIVSRVKKGGFVTLRHNSLRDLTANILKEICKDVSIEPPILIPEMKQNQTFVQEDFGLVSIGNF